MADDDSDTSWMDKYVTPDDQSTQPQQEDNTPTDADTKQLTSQDNAFDVRSQTSNTDDPKSYSGEPDTSWMDKYVQKPDDTDPRNPYGEATQTSPTSAAGVGFREAVRGILPTVGGAAAGIAAGTLAAPTAPFTAGLGPLAVGAGAGIVAGGAIRELQDKISDTLGLDSPESRAQDIREHPTAATIGSLAPAVTAFNPGTLATTLAQRGGAAAIMGGIDIGSQAVEKGITGIDPIEAGLSAGVGFALPEANKSTLGLAGKISGQNLVHVGRPNQPPAEDLAASRAESTKANRDTTSPARGTAYAQPAPADAGHSYDPYFPYRDSKEGPAPPSETPAQPSSAKVQVDGLSTQPDVQAALAGEPIGPGSQLQEGEFGYEGPQAPETTPDNTARSLGEGEIAQPGSQEGEGQPPPGPPAGLRAPGQQPDLFAQTNPEGQRPAPPQTPPAVAPTPAVAPPPAEQVRAISRARDVSKKGTFGKRNIPAPAPEPAEVPPEPPMSEERARAAALPAEYQGAPTTMERIAMKNAGTWTPDLEAAYQKKVQAYRDNQISAEVVRPTGQTPTSAGAALPSRIKMSPEEVARMPVGESENPEDFLNPGPKSLSAAAPGGQADFRNNSPADVAKGKSNIMDALKQIGTSPRDAWRTAFSPEHLQDKIDKEGPEKFDLVVRGNQEAVNAARKAHDDAMLELQRQSNSNSTPAEREDFMDNFQKGTLDPKNRLAPLSQSAFDAAKDYAKRLATEDPDGDWQNNMLPHMWDPSQVDRVKDFITDWKEQGRKGVPTIGDIRAAGWKQMRPDILRSDGSVDPILLQQRLHTGYDAFLEGKGIMNDALQKGLISQVEGPGLTRLNEISHSGPLYAEDGVATMWNRYFKPDMLDPTSKSFIGAAQAVKNYGTLWQLALNLYHGTAISTETIVGDVMRSINAAAEGKLGKAGATLGKAIGAPVTRAKFSFDEYKKTLTEGAEDGTITGDALRGLQKGGMTPARIARYTPDLNSGGLRGYFDAWHKSALKLEATEKLGRINAAYNKYGAIEAGAQTAKEGFRVMGEALQTTMEPMFNHFIPRAKVGAAWEQMKDWVDSNQGLRESDPRQYEKNLAKAGRDIWKSVEDRLGELNQSTLYWNRTLKYAANLLMISPGWETGTLRAFFGGATDLAKHPIKSLQPGSEHYKPNAAYPFAFLITTAAINSMYQYLKTGEMPKDVPDIAFPRTGGKLPTGEAERAIGPGYEKDVWSWVHTLMGHEGLSRNVSSDLYNKLSLVPRTFWDTMANKNWAGKQIYNPSDTAQNKMMQYLQYVHANMMPIGVSQQEKLAPDSAISRGETLFGVKRAPSAFVKSESTNKFLDKQNAREQKATDKFYAKQSGQPAATKTTSNAEKRAAHAAKVTSKSRGQASWMDKYATH